MVEDPEKIPESINRRIDELQEEESSSSRRVKEFDI
jgi:hypothetical protein